MRASGWGRAAPDAQQAARRLVDAALAAYRRTIQLFPDTKWAAVAKQRIHELRPDAALARPHNELT